VSHALITANGIAKSFAGKTAVDDLSLSINAGEIYALMGPDGAGKTTTMRLLSGILTPEAGEITLDGILLMEQPEMARSRIGYLAQRFSLYEDLSVNENIRFFAEVRGVPSGAWRERAHEVLAFVDMLEFGDRIAGALSGGMKQKLALAVALIHRPPILLLDEPTGGVDPITRQAFWRLITRLLGEGIAVLLSTPYMDEAARCHRVGFLYQGRKVVEGTPAELIRFLAGKTLMLRGEPLRHWASITREIAGVELVQPFGDNLHLIVDQGVAEQVISAVQRQARHNPNLELDEIVQIPASLEDAFVDILRGQSA
jgi:ABC-2 type transport system ATP-binding protein